MRSLLPFPQLLLAFARFCCNPTRIDYSRDGSGNGEAALRTRTSFFLHVKLYRNP